MKKILVIAFSNLSRDARVRRQVNMLKKNYKVSVACLGGDVAPDYELLILRGKKLTFTRRLVLGFFLLVRWFSKAHGFLYPYSYFTTQTRKENFDLVIANDMETLPLAFDVAGQSGGKILFDAHEYAPRHFEDKPVWKMFFQPMNIYLCRKFIPRVGGMLTIGEGLAKAYEMEYPVSPVIMTNANRYYDLNPSPVKDSSIKLVHHGIATPSRKLEYMIEMMEYLDNRFTLDMYLLSEGFSAKKTIDYPAKLKKLARNSGRVRILPPLSSEGIVTTINQYDVGVFLIPPVNFNYANTLPNKLFDFIQARLAIAIGPTPEMARLVHQYNIGVVSDDFTPQNLAQHLNKLTTDSLTQFKQNSMLAARQLNAEENEKVLLKVVGEMI